MEDRPGGRVDVMPAAGAGPRLTLLGSLIPLERRLFAVLRAVGGVVAGGVAGVPQPFQAGFVVGEVPHEFEQRVLRF